MHIFEGSMNALSLEKEKNDSKFIIPSYWIVTKWFSEREAKIDFDAINDLPLENLEKKISGYSETNPWIPFGKH